MNKHFIAAVAAGSVIMMFVGLILYGIVFADLFRDGAMALPGVMRQEPRIGWILAGQLGMALLLTLVISWRGATSFLGGAGVGLLFGFLMAAGIDFAQYGTTHLWTLRATLLDPVITAALSGSAGAVIGWILGRATKPPNRT